MGLFSAKNDDQYRELAFKIGRGEKVSSVDRQAYEDYKKQVGAVPRELAMIEEAARRKSTR